MCGLILSSCSSSHSSSSASEPVWPTDVLAGDTWLYHYEQDIKPFWTTADALGPNSGNFPTIRQMDGTPTKTTYRRPRMMGRQTYQYAMGYMLTGDETLLQHAKDGANWLMTKARDTQHGGWYTRLDITGSPYLTEDKTSQDTSYATLGPAAYFYITRDKASEDCVLGTRDLIFSTYWDAANNRVKDAMDYTMTTEKNMSGSGWDLVAELDQINAYMLLTQPVLTDSTRSAQFLTDMQTLGQTILKNFWSDTDGMFFGAVGDIGNYHANNTDFGHNIKTLWMLYTIDKRTTTHPFKDFVMAHIYNFLDTAYDTSYGSWGQQLSDATTVSWGASWWVFCELDQVTATMNLIDNRYQDRLAKTTRFWLDHFRDQKYGEVYDGVQRNGSGNNWSVADTAKCADWKNAFHSTEHSVVLYILGRVHEGKDVDLYFAVPEAQVNTFVATPYIYSGHEKSRIDLGATSVDGLHKVKVTFDQIY